MHIPATMWTNIATLGPVGRMRPAPGSWGSAVALLVGAGLAATHNWLLEVAVLVVCIIGVVAANKYEDATGSKDASEVVIDEVAGQWIPILVVPIDWKWLVAAFILFRLFDIAKPGPVKMAENLPRGWGVMADDIIAGVFAAICLLLAQLALTQGGLA